MAQSEIRVEGLRELGSSLRKAGNGLQNDLKAAHKASADIVVREAKSRAPVKTGRLRDSLKSLASVRNARISGGKKTVPYYGWIDFGGTIAPKGTAIKRTYLKEGRIMYPAISAKRDEIVNKYERQVREILRKAGLDRT